MGFGLFKNKGSEGLSGRPNSQSFVQGDVVTGSLSIDLSRPQCPDLQSLFALSHYKHDSAC